MSKIPIMKQRTHKLIPIVTDRIVIRRFELSDAKAFYTYTKDKEITKYLECTPSKNYQTVSKFIEALINRYSTDKMTRFAIADKMTGGLIGAISIYWYKDGTVAEYGYWVGREHWSKGYITEVLNTLNIVLKLIGVSRVFIQVNQKNIQSIKAATKVGMRMLNTEPVQTENGLAVFYGLTL